MPFPRHDNWHSRMKTSVHRISQRTAEALGPDGATADRLLLDLSTNALECVDGSSPQIYLATENPAVLDSLVDQILALLTTTHNTHLSILRIHFFRIQVVALSRMNSTRLRKVAIVMMHPDRDGQSDEALRVNLRLKREAAVWASLKHKNLVPFFGISNDIAPWPALISPFYEFGHVETSLHKYPQANRQATVTGVASVLGYMYLHAHEVAHGDFKVQNVLVDEERIACIGNFGISKLINRRGFTTVSVGTLPYMAPELLIALGSDGPSKEPVFCPSTTKSSNVYSFALLVLEILASQAPKGRPHRPFMAPKDVSELRPKRVDGIPDEVWSILDQCWAFEPQARPGILDVLHQLTLAFQNASTEGSSTLA
ncbi:kinase-like domain-containing protein [Mycena crocata]|nr:kinase-like domain-containing protein [Mycena crocata]